MNLHALIVEYVNTADPSEPADLIAKRISTSVSDENELHACFEQLLIIEVRNVRGQKRRDSFDRLQQETDQNRTEPQGCNVGFRVSHKVEAIAAWAQLLREHVTSVDGHDILIADATVADLEANITYRRNLAARNHARADQLEHLKSLLETYEVSTPKELPDDAIT